MLSSPTSASSQSLVGKKPTCANGGGSCASHAGSYQAAILHQNAAYENVCLRCAQIVYQVDKIGPLKDFTFFHQGCFKCLVCGTKLTLKTYFNSQQDQEDKEVTTTTLDLALLLIALFCELYLFFCRFPTIDIWPSNKVSTWSTHSVSCRLSFGHVRFHALRSSSPSFSLFVLSLVALRIDII